VSISYDAALTLFRRAEYVRLIAEAGRDARALPPRIRVMVAYALAGTDAVGAARDLAALDGDPPAPTAIRAQAELARGLAEWRSGGERTALLHFQTAVRLAAESSDAEQLARAWVHVLRLTLSTESIDAGLAALPEARRVVTRAGIPQLVAWLHNCVAVIEGRIGNLDEAARHCAIVEQLLDGAPEESLAGVLRLNLSVINIRRCQFRAAEQQLQASARAMQKTGSTIHQLEVASNRAYAEMMTGRYADAERTLRHVLAHSPITRTAKIGTLDSLARVYLARGRLAECEALLDRAESTDDGPINSYQRDMVGLTRIRLSLRQGRYEDALARMALLQAHDDAHRDVPTGAALHMAAAEASAAIGNPSAAARHLLAAASAGMTTLREAQGQIYFGAAAVLGDDASGLAASLRARAHRVWDEQGVVHPLLEMGAGSREADGQAPAILAPPDIGRVADGLAAVFDLAHRPRLAGRELLSLLWESGCTPEAQMVVTAREAPAPPSTETHVALPLGVHDDRAHTLVCRIPDEPRDAIVLNGILTIGRAAVALEEARRADRRRAAIWPTAPLEQQPDALFVADEMRTLLAAAQRIAATTVPVLITGETGTGKEVLARTIHAHSTRARAPFLPFSCTSVPKDMLDSQLFGHRKGAFTGAAEHFAGVIRSAAGGTLFLDEIGEIPLDVQPKLLRFLESGEVHPIGEPRPIPVDVRVIAATNADLERLMADGRFREDLFYRLNIVRLSVPPLRERRTEITALATHYLNKYALEYLKGDLRLAEETVEYLVLYRWPGNVRQLANEMRRIAAFAEPGAVLMPEHLSPEIVAARRTVPASERPLEPTELIVRLDQPLDAAVEHVERALIQYAMRQCAGRMDDTASLLGLSRKGLYLKRQRLGLEQPGDAADVVQ
jgi:DNA-binding NtrC family response regulator/tetratricopeptide (TPR) repeat protein